MAVPEAPVCRRGINMAHNTVSPHASMRPDRAKSQGEETRIWGMPWPAAEAGEGRGRREALSRAPGVKRLPLCSQGPSGAVGSGVGGSPCCPDTTSTTQPPREHSQTAGRGYWLELLGPDTSQRTCRGPGRVLDPLCPGGAWEWAAGRTGTTCSALVLGPPSP